MYITCPPRPAGAGGGAGELEIGNWCLVIGYWHVKSTRGFKYDII